MASIKSGREDKCPYFAANKTFLNFYSSTIASLLKDPYDSYHFFL